MKKFLIMLLLSITVKSYGAGFLDELEYHHEVKEVVSELLGENTLITEDVIESNSSNETVILSTWLVDKELYSFTVIDNIFSEMLLMFGFEQFINWVEDDSGVHCGWKKNCLNLVISVGDIGEFKVIMVGTSISS